MPIEANKSVFLLTPVVSLNESSQNTPDALLLQLNNAFFKQMFIANSHVPRGRLKAMAVDMAEFIRPVYLAENRPEGKSPKANNFEVNFRGKNARATITGQGHRKSGQGLGQCLYYKGSDFNGWRGFLKSHKHPDGKLFTTGTIGDNLAVVAEAERMITAYLAENWVTVTVDDTATKFGAPAVAFDENALAP